MVVLIGLTNAPRHLDPLGIEKLAKVFEQKSEVKVGPKYSMYAGLPTKLGSIPNI